MPDRWVMHVAAPHATYPVPCNTTWSHVQGATPHGPSVSQVLPHMRDAALLAMHPAPCKAPPHIHDAAPLAMHPVPCKAPPHMRDAALLAMPPAPCKAPPHMRDAAPLAMHPAAGSPPHAQCPVPCWACAASLTRAARMLCSNTGMSWAHTAHLWLRSMGRRALRQ